MSFSGNFELGLLADLYFWLGEVFVMIWDLRGFQGVFGYKEYSALLGDLALGECFLIEYGVL